MMKRLGVIVGVVILGSLWLVKEQPWQATHESPEISQAVVAPKAGMGTPKITHNTHTEDESTIPNFKTGLEALAPSLRGTEVDGGFMVDEAGHLVPSLHTRHLFDYFLSAQGEEPFSHINARVEAYIRDQLPETAAAEAVALWHQYVDYLQQAQELQEHAPNKAIGAIDLLAMRSVKEDAKALRQAIFDAHTHEAFFGEEEAHDDYTLARLEVMEDPYLSATEKAARVAMLTEQMPAEFQREQQEVNQLITLQQLTAEARQSGGSEEDIIQLRRTLVGEEGAQRLEALDQQRSQWQQRLEAWRKERAAIVNNPNLSQADKEAELEQRRAEHFDERERLRVLHLEAE